MMNKKSLGPIVKKSELLFSLTTFNHPGNYMLRPALKVGPFVEDKTIEPICQSYYEQIVSIGQI
jgi:hypothetical protein